MFLFKLPGISQVFFTVFSLFLWMNDPVVNLAGQIFRMIEMEKVLSSSAKNRVALLGESAITGPSPQEIASRQEIASISTSAG